jgi:hypothetical protein
MYLALLNDFRGTREAAQLAGLQRATGYRVLQRLLDRGMIAGDGRKPQRYRAVDPSVLFRRLELFYRDETEIPSFLAEAFGSKTGGSSRDHLPYASPTELPRILVAEGRAVHPALFELSQAKRSVAAVVRPLSTPVQYRNALAKTLGRLARGGVHVRVLTDALPIDHRFFRGIIRETGGAPVPLQVRYYSPLASNLYAIDRQKVVRLPTLGVSNRTAPLAVAIDDPARVRTLENRFETLWTDAVVPSRKLRLLPETPSEVGRSGTVVGSY